MTRALAAIVALALALPARADDAPSCRAQVAALHRPLTVVRAAALVTTIGRSSLSCVLAAKAPDLVAGDQPFSKAGPGT